MSEIKLIGSIARVILFVKNPQNVAKFYQEGLGLIPMGESSAEWVELSAGSCSIALHKSISSASERGEKATKIVFGVADVSGAKALLESRGVKMGAVYSFEAISFCDGTDPEGNKFQLSNRGLMDPTKS